MGFKELVSEMVMVRKVECKGKLQIILGIFLLRQVGQIKTTGWICGLIGNLMSGKYVYTKPSAICVWDDEGGDQEKI